MTRNKKYKTEKERLEAIKITRKKAQKKYFLSEKGKKALKKYHSSEKGKNALKKSYLKFAQSEKGRNYIKTYLNSENFKEAYKKYRSSDKGKKMLKKFYSSDKFKKARDKYKKSEKGKKTQNKWFRKKRKEDAFFKIRFGLSARLSQFLKSKGQRKASSIVKLIGCTKKELINHLEKQFYPNPKTGEAMTWKNHSLKGWHIDHINPLNAFRKSDLARIETQKKAMNYKNLQPLWAEENLKKSDK